VANYFTLEVYTPYRLFYSAPVEVLSLTLSDGEIGVYAGHIPFTAPVLTGLLKIKDKAGKWNHAFIAEGVLEVTARRSVLLVNDAEWPAEIDYDRARAARDLARETIQQSTFKFEAVGAQAALKRAEMRIRVYEEFQGQKTAQPGPVPG
jgi:F-type H+-transporting ATPase subunit epsilon